MQWGLQVLFADRIPTKMTVDKRFSPSLATAFWLVTMTALWLAFAPVRAGGMASYVIVVGNSMEPGFHLGDLIVTHEESVYRIGDAVVYRNRELENFVFHRIIAEEKGRFTLKGDNNSWIDTYQPAPEEIIGKLWLYIPNGGRFIQAIRQPAVMALLAGALGGLLALGFFSANTKGRKQMNKDLFSSIKQRMSGVLRITPTNSPPSQQGGFLETIFFALGLIAFSSLILGILSFSRPATRSVRDDIGYDQLGFFAYTASAPDGIYDSNAVKSGDPVFTKSVCAVDMAFQYTLVAAQAENITGSYQLTAVLVEPTSGWQRTVPLQDKTSFSGNAFGATAKLDFCQMEKLAQAMEQSTDFHPGSYLLTISPNIRVSGEIAGRPLDDTFNSSLVFRYDRVHFYLLKDEELGENLLNASRHGTLGGERLDANTLRILGGDVAIPALRIISMLGLVISLGGLTFLAWKLQGLAQADPLQFIRVRYGSHMIDVQQGNLPGTTPVVDVASIEDLGKLAERFQTVILHTESGESHAYYVQGAGNLYRLAMNLQKTGSTVPEKEVEGKA
jgi:signal peptidase I